VSVKKSGSPTAAKSLDFSNAWEEKRFIH
jgi:hypothetical protein